MRSIPSTIGGNLYVEGNGGILQYFGFCSGIRDQPFLDQILGCGGCMVYPESSRQSLSRKVWVMGRIAVYHQKLSRAKIVGSGIFDFSEDVRNFGVWAGGKATSSPHRHPHRHSPPWCGVRHKAPRPKVCQPQFMYLSVGRG